MLSRILGIVFLVGCAHADEECTPVSFPSVRSAVLAPSATTHRILVREGNSYTAYELTNTPPFSLLRTIPHFEKELSACAPPISGITVLLADGRGGFSNRRDIFAMTTSAMPSPSKSVTSDSNRQPTSRGAPTYYVDRLSWKTIGSFSCTWLRCLPSRPPLAECYPNRPPQRTPAWSTKVIGQRIAIAGGAPHQWEELPRRLSPVRYLEAAALRQLEGLEIVAEDAMAGAYAAHAALVLLVAGWFNLY